jgi:hypothetical protein
LKPLDSIHRLVDRAAGLPATPIQLCGLFAATFIARNLMEAAALGTLFPAPAFFLHFPVAYVFPLTGLAGLLHLFSGYPLGRLLKVMVFAWTLTLLPPLLDIVMGSSTAIGYFPLEKSNAVHFLLNFFNPSVELPGTTMGIRVEALAGCLLAGLFTASVRRGRRLVWGAATTLVFAPVFLVFFTWPYLVYVVTSGLFPWAEGAQVYMQWHAITEPHLTGSAHYTIFILDSLPVILVSAWFLSVLLPEEWRRAVSKLRGRAHDALAPLAGTAAVVALALHTRAATFADCVTIAGASAAALLLLASTGFTQCRWAVIAAALLVSAAAGWPTFVAAALASALSALPGPRRLAGAIFLPALLAVAASPAAIPLDSPLFGIMLLLAALAGLTGPGRLPAGIVPLLGAFAVGLFTGPLEPAAWLVSQERTTDTFTRSGRVAYGLVSAGREAAAGGGLLRLVETAQLTGMTARAEWAWSLALARGDSSPGMLKAGVNLAFASGDDRRFMELLGSWAAAGSSPGDERLMAMVTARAARNGDLEELDRIHSMTGPSPALFQAYSEVFLQTGDTAQAVSCAEASVQAPGALPEQYAWAIDLRSRTVGDYDGLFREASREFPGSVDLMTARLRAPLSAGLPPDRRDLLDRCLLLDPVSVRVLETAALWHLASGSPDSALAYAERALAASAEPGTGTFVLACTAASGTGDRDRTLIHARYGLALHPGEPSLEAFLSGAAGSTDGP